MPTTVNSIQRDTRKMAPADAALTHYLRMPESGDVEGCINSCIEQLIVEHGLSRTEAERIAMQAYADNRCINRREWLDIDRSTSNLITIQTTTGPIHFTVADVMHAMERYRAESTVH
ncbi:hypothetical protein R84981_001145 [Carnimonas sp. R-84981]|uniref:hypothetical protein n=1 Tax=Carnimonas bestiolae TaxID=3402172 RepID=UPI003EDB99DD